MPGSIERPRWRVILLPGGVLPAEPAYKNLLAELGGDVDARTKDLEVYAADRPPPDFSLDTEIGGITGVADTAGFDRFHLVGYSGGGASSLAFTAAYPDRVLSLALLEPAWAGNEELSPAGSGSTAGLSVAARSAAAGIHGELRPLSARARRETAASTGWPAASLDGQTAGRTGGVHRRLRQGASRSGAPAEFQAAGLLRSRRPQQSGLLRADGRAARPRLSRFHARDLPGAPPLRPAHRIEPAKVADSLRRLWLRADPQPA